VRTVAPQSSADDAWALMRRERVRHLVVVADSRVVGVLSDRDVGGRNGATVRAYASVGDLMSGGVVTVAPDDTLRKVANLMRGRSIGCVPVLSGTRLVGIITTSDLLTVLGRGLDRPSRPERHGLSHRAPHRKAHGAYGVW
jgi:acetoin utilization protein AcuB